MWTVLSYMITVLSRHKGEKAFVCSHSGNCNGICFLLTLQHNLSPVETPTVFTFPLCRTAVAHSVSSPTKGELNWGISASLHLQLGHGSHHLFITDHLIFSVFSHALF